MEKIKEIINKILGKPSDSSDSSDKSGFTLVELLIVIAVIGILAAALLVAIDPIDKINAANDSSAQKDLAGVASALEAYAVTNNGVYPTTLAELVTNGDLRSVPDDITWSGGVLSVTLTSKKNMADGPVFKYETTSGKKCLVATAGTACP